MKTVTVRDLRNNFSKVEAWLGEGEEIRIEKESVGLCRCGASKDKPLCDGTHREIGFEADEFTL